MKQACINWDDSPVVCACNLIKCVCICCTSYCYHKTADCPLPNLGDAICSFLENPDRTTRGMGVVSKQQITSGVDVWHTPKAKMYEFKRPRWRRAVT